MIRNGIVGCSLWLVCTAWGDAVAAPADDARAAAARGDRAAAIAAWQAAVAAEPDRPEHYEALGREQLRARDFDGAIATYQGLVQAHPSYTQGRYRLAFALRKAGRFERAAEAYRSYNAAAPTAPDGFFGLARTLEELKDAPGARAAYARYVELEKRASEAEWVERARVRMSEIDAELARLAEGDPTGPSEAASAEVSAGAAAPVPPAAPAVTARVAALPPVEPPGQGTVAPLVDSPLAQATPAADPDAAFASGQYAEAANGYLAQAASGGGQAVHYRAAVAAVIAGDPVVGSGAALAALRGDPANGPAARLAGATASGPRPLTPPDAALISVDAAIRDGRLRTAARLASRALASAPDATARGALSWARGRALAGVGRFDEALVALKEAAGVFPADPDLWADLAAVAERRGDRATARSFRALAASVAPAGHPLTTSEAPPAEGR